MPYGKIIHNVIFAHTMINGCSLHGVQQQIYRPDILNLLRTHMTHKNNYIVHSLPSHLVLAVPHGVDRFTAKKVIYDVF